MKQWFVLSGKLALNWLWTCRNTYYETNERTIQHFPHSCIYKLYISLAIHIDFILQSNMTLWVFDVSHIVSPDSFGTCSAILLLEHEFPKRERRHFVIFCCLLKKHGKCFYSTYFNLLLYSAF